MCLFAGCFSHLLCSERGWKQSQWKQENETGRKSSLRTQEFQQQGVSIALPCTEGHGENGAHLPPLPLSPTPSFPQIIGKISFFLTLQTNLLQSFYKQLVEMNFHPQKHWPRTIVLVNKVRWPLLGREYFLPGFLWYTVGLGLEIKISAFKLTPSGNCLSSEC